MSGKTLQFHHISINEAIHTFLSSPNRKAALRDWQHLTGSLNWSLNVLPWARPALTEMYRKMSGKTLQFCHIPINGYDL
ncbi:hypothetical protein FB446DRAFT_795683 [Lentinula raphanica]|nr:hypothetical protein FB446DRAFT_795683 [Lentinula raphanica]